jgi:hypothetical protein
MVEGQRIESRKGRAKEDIFVVERRKYRRIWVKLPYDHPPVRGEQITGRIALDAGEGGLRGHLSRTIEVGIC